MQLFYSPDLENSLTLPFEESQHCIKVLRKTEGEIIRVTDGKGSFYECRIIDAHPKACRLEIIGKEEEAGRPYKLHIAIAPAKSGVRMDWFIEKAVEIGIDEISFIDCDHSERGRINLERFNKIAVSAMKQSLKASLPLFHDLQPFTKFIKSNKEISTCLIGYCGDIKKKSLNSFKNETDIIFCIGPEGDFSANEIDLAIASGFQAVEIGSSRLRTETAAITVCSYFYFSA
jgi:16S rRNA (uracil1498-N3)-methyltransferase